MPLNSFRWPCYWSQVQFIYFEGGKIFFCTVDNKEKWLTAYMKRTAHPEPVLAKCSLCNTVLFPNTFTVACNAFWLISSKCFSKIQTFKKIIHVFECIFLWRQAEILKWTFKKMAWSWVQQTCISKAAGTKKSDKNQGIQKSSVCFRNLWSVSPVSFIFKA